MISWIIAKCLHIIQYNAMSAHSNSVYNNLCVRTPKNPRNAHPFPVYEQKYLNQLENESRRKQNLIEQLKITGNEDNKMEKNDVKSFIEFYDSIPDYNDLNHLSNRDFYKKLENLKEKQQKYHELMQKDTLSEEKNTSWIEDYKKLNISDKKPKNKAPKKPNIKPFCSTPLKSALHDRKLDEDVEYISISEKEATLKPPSRRSVRIETPSSDKYSFLNDTPEPIRPKSRIQSSMSSTKDAQSEWENFSADEFDELAQEPRETKSAPNSPSRNVGWKENGITIPKPFQMTVRDEENKIIDEVLIPEPSKEDEDKFEMFKANPIPIESQIPLFDKIMADQEYKNHVVRERSKAQLQAQMRPFSFTKRDEEIQEITKRLSNLSKSSPSLFLDAEKPRKKKFKAKPIPKNLFSNYIYQKMYEDEFYRALQKKIRAEEMLRAASLPPSMAKRERTKPKYDVCPRSYKNLYLDSDDHLKSKKIPNYKKMHEQFEKDLEELKNEFITTSPRPFKFKTSRRSEKKSKKCRECSASSKTSSNPSSAELRAVSRSNLAALLRVQSARKRQEEDMYQKLEEAKLKEESRWREKVMRKKPVWQALAYSHEEDLAMRLQLRRDEERLRHEEHRMRMELMLGRVNQQPTLFERQSQVKFPKTRAELIETLYDEYAAEKHNEKMHKRCRSSLKQGRIVEMKDEEVQASVEDESMDSSNKDEASDATYCCE